VTSDRDNDGTEALATSAEEVGDGWQLDITEPELVAAVDRIMTGGDGVVEQGWEKALDATAESGVAAAKTWVLDVALGYELGLMEVIRQTAWSGNECYRESVYMYDDWPTLTDFLAPYHHGELWTSATPWITFMYAFEMTVNRLIGALEEQVSKRGAAVCWNDPSLEMTSALARRQGATTTLSGGGFTVEVTEDEAEVIRALASIKTYKAFTDAVMDRVEGAAKNKKLISALSSEGFYQACKQESVAVGV
jgi:hypothetical protein